MPYLSSLSNLVVPSARLPRGQVAATLAASSLLWAAVAGAQPAAGEPAAPSSNNTRPRPVVTAPSLNAMGAVAQPEAASAPLAEAAPADGSAPAGAATPKAFADPMGAVIPNGTATLPTPAASTGAQDDYPWLLDSEQRPWALAYLDVESLNTLYLTPPSEQEVRVMLPGGVLDASERIKAEINRYFTDNTGLTRVARTRQLDTFNTWLVDTSKKKMALPLDPWVRYQFHREASSTIAEFKAKVLRQSAPGMSRMASDVRKAIEQLSAVMNATGGHEQKMQWYSLLVQLRDGFTLFQTRVAAADRQVLEAIERFEQDNPPVARPPGTPPRNRSTPATGTALPGGVALTTDAVARAPAQPLAQKVESTNPAGAWVVLAGMALVVLGMFMKLRRRVARKQVAVEDPAR